MVLTTDSLWLVIVGFIIALVLAFGIGANDVANSFGTSVGSKVLTLRQACILATIFEIAGAVLIGYKVSDTIRKGILEVHVYEGHEVELMLGFLATLASSAIWLLIATFFNLPISGTHTVIGATLGFSLVARGTEGVTWSTVYTIIASWFVSPLSSGLVSSVIYWIVQQFIVIARNPLKAGLISLPIFYSITVFVNVLSVIFDGPELLYLDGLQQWLSVVISLTVGIVVALLVHLILVPRQRRKIQNAYDSNITNGVITNGIAKDSVTPGEIMIEDMDSIPKTVSTTSSQVELVNDSPPNSVIMKQEGPKDVSQLFSYLQVLTAIFGSFAHGGNDVSNAIGPLIGLYLLYQEGTVVSKSETPIWVLFYGGVGIAIGLWVWGRRVIKTIGNDLTTITPISGFTIEVGAAMTVLLASNLGLPISTTHCKVGSIVFVGYTSNSKFLMPKNKYEDVENSGDTADGENIKKSVDWMLFRNIFVVWMITLPIAAGISALIMFIFTKALL